MNIDEVIQELNKFANSDEAMELSHEDYYEKLNNIAKKADGWPLKNKSYSMISQSEYDEMYNNKELPPDGLSHAYVIMDDDDIPPDTTIVSGDDLRRNIEEGNPLDQPRKFTSDDLPF